MRSLSSMISEVRSQTAEVNNIVDRLRSASRSLTGSTGQAPTDINSIKGQPVPEPERPLMQQLDFELERLNSATADLRNEMSHVETYSETGEMSAKQTQLYATQGVGSARA